MKERKKRKAKKRNKRPSYVCMAIYMLCYIYNTYINT